MIMIIITLLHRLIWFLLCIMSLTKFIQGSGVNANMSCIETERQALLAFKKTIVDHQSILYSWRTSNPDCCVAWEGVRCDNTGHVFSLDLGYDAQRHPLSGDIGSSLLELPYLRRLNLSDNDFHDVPMFIGSLHNLTYLDLSGNRFSGPFPYQLGNLSMLQVLDLHDNFDMRADNLEWLSCLSSLRNLYLSTVNFSKASGFFQAIQTHPSLTKLELKGCQFPELDPLSLSRANSSKTLHFLHFISNDFAPTSLLSYLSDISHVLVDLKLVDNKLMGPVPNSFGDMTWLQFVDLSCNQLEGGIPSSFRNLCRLRSLDLSHNNLSGRFDDHLEHLKCAKNSIEMIRLNGNQLEGSIPDITEFKSLTSFYLQDNHLDGTFPERFNNLSQLGILDVQRNRLNGIVTDVHLSAFPQLKQLHLSENSLALDVSPDWLPSFQLQVINLRSCKLGPHFPNLLQTQANFYYLDISKANISDVVPTWFWNFSPSLMYLNLSFNHMHGQVPNLPFTPNSSPSPEIDLSNNFFFGPIPQFLLYTTVLNLSKNRFQGPLSVLCTETYGDLCYLDLSHNRLSGELTDCWDGLKNLIILDLGSNNLSGTIPSSIGSLTRVETLRMRNNRLTGELPSSLKNCSSLELLDVGENRLTGQVPAWIGESLVNLIVLLLRANEFHGNIPSKMCHLSSIQVLDLSFNNLSGTIPTCLDNLAAMVSNQAHVSTIASTYYWSYNNSEALSFWSAYGYYVNDALILWKGFEQDYGNTLGLLKIIDLSSNDLIGEIPREVTRLLGLISLNLSRNNLSGPIPAGIGQLKVLEVLDLSRNQLSGEIPSSLADMSLLNTLDLSRNKLTGRIPTSTQLQSFDPSSYNGNPELCGCPLPNKCPGDRNGCSGEKRKDLSPTAGNIGNKVEEGDEFFDRSCLYAGVGLGFVVGFWGFCGPLILSRTWRFTYYQFLSNIVDWLYLKIARLRK